MGGMADKGAAGIGVDAAGNPVIDPTQNVLDLVEAAVKRLDDLRESDRQHEHVLAELRHMYEKEQRDADAAHVKELREAESKRIDAIRAVDVAAVQRAAEVQGVTAETLRANVAATAAAAATALSTALEPILKSIADLQRAQYETQGGKQQTSETRLNYGTVIGGVGLLVAVMAIVVAIIVGTR